MDPVDPRVKVSESMAQARPVNGNRTLRRQVGRVAAKVQLTEHQIFGSHYCVLPTTALGHG